MMTVSAANSSAEPRRAARSIEPPTRGARVPAATIAGLLLLGSGAVFLMGIITAEALSDVVYTTHGSELSDLGATAQPGSVSHQPSSAIFNTVMAATGAMILVASYFLHRGLGVRRVTISMAILGVGVLGVGLFPGNRDPYHGIFALAAFVGGGVAAILSAHVQRAPMRYVSIALGAVCLGTLLFAIVGSSTVVFKEMGDGGVERWVAYPITLWLVSFGGYLLSRGAADAPEVSR